eukprot:2715095-Rhodomonas_salina.1
MSFVVRRCVELTDLWPGLQRGHAQRSHGQERWSVWPVWVVECGEATRRKSKTLLVLLFWLRGYAKATPCLACAIGAFYSQAQPRSSTSLKSHADLCSSLDFHHPGLQTQHHKHVTSFSFSLTNTRTENQVGIAFTAIETHSTPSQYTSNRRQKTTLRREPDVGAFFGGDPRAHSPKDLNLFCSRAVQSSFQSWRGNSQSQSRIPHRECLRHSGRTMPG